MARQFNGTLDSAQSASTLDLSGVATLSVAFWEWVNAFDSTDRCTLETSASWTANDGGWTYFANTSSFPGKVISGYNSATFLTYAYANQPTAAAWHHYVLTMDRGAGSQRVKIYIDGALPASITYVDTPSSGNFGNYKLNVFARNGGASFLEAGRLAELGIWPGLILGADDIAALYAGYRPPKVRPDKLGWYYPCHYPGASAEPELVKANAMSLVETSSADHPRIIY